MTKKRILVSGGHTNNKDKTRNKGFSKNAIFFCLLERSMVSLMKEGERTLALATHCVVLQTSESNVEVLICFTFFNGIYVKNVILFIKNDFLKT
jgi:hypothetical protein